jgi:hypothetical protein
MSYVVHLWQQPVPGSLSQAETTLRELRRQIRFEPYPPTAALLSAIESALPTDGDADDYWRELPDRDAFDLVISLSPSVAELTVVVPAIEAAARRLGWVVFDPQCGEVLLPSGQVLSRAGTHVDRAEQPLPADLQSSPAARKAWLRQSLAPVFTRHGWHELHGEFCFGKKLPCANVRIYLETQRQVTMRHGVWLQMVLPARLQPALNSDGGPELMISLEHIAQRHRLAFAHDGQSGSTIGGTVGSPTYGLPCSSAEDVACRRDELAALYDSVVLDWIDSLTSLQALEHLANRVPDDDCPFLALRQRGGFQRLLNYHPDLLLAAAVDAPDFEQRALERLNLYEADGFGRGLVPQLRELIRICGLSV